jgi:uncharacterized protein YyaL (SSP411 family)
MAMRDGNALADARSPFLQHGAHQPVHWQPWSDEVFARARREDRPVLLDIGAVWCHWCHVMDRESYDNPETAALINELFIAVKVDRDERPDVDARYQRAVQVLTGQGGWPLTAFLTPEGEVFYGGTYFPPDDRFGRPSFARVLREVARVWHEEKERARAAAAQISERLEAAAGAEVRSGELAAQLITDTLEELAHTFDFRHGGFGRAPKFPNAGALDLLLDEYAERGTEWARRIVDDTLSAMIRGGIYDQLGGGFHRYSVDAQWLIPHFEKMAYDNGVLLSTCARAASALQHADAHAAAEGIVAYYGDVAPALLEAGGFPASQDADFSPDDDGDYWTWTSTELRDVLGAEDRVRLAIDYFGVEQPASAMHLDPSRHVLYRALSPAALAQRYGRTEAEIVAVIADVQRTLKAARERRPRPYVDETLYAGWTALVASGFLNAARFAGIENAKGDALRALDRIWADGFREQRGVLHRLGDDSAGYHVDDQAHTALALLDAFELTQDARWLDRCRTLLRILLQRYRDPVLGALQDTPRDETSDVAPLQRPYLPITDAPAPSGNASAALALLRLAALEHDEHTRDDATAILRAFAGSASRLGSAAATYVKAVAWAVHPVTTIIVVEDDGGALLAEALRAVRPRTVVRRLDPANVTGAALLPELAAMVTGEVPRAYVCAGRACAAPVTTATQLAETLRTFRS